MCPYMILYLDSDKIKTALSTVIIFWSERWDSNPRPLGPEPSALPSCATSRNIKNQREIIGHSRLKNLKRPCQRGLGHLCW